MRLAIGAIIAAALAVPTMAGDWQPNPNVVHQFAAPPGAPSQPTPDENQWVEALVANLRRGGANPRFVYRFSRSSADYRVNGEASPLPIFVYRDNPDIFIVVAEDGRPYAKFVINFSDRVVGTYGHGTSLYVPPSKRFCVIVLDRDWGIGGIPVIDDDENPQFRDRTVTWH